MFAISSENSRFGTKAPKPRHFRGLGWVLAGVIALGICPVSRILADDKQAPENKDDKSQVDPLKREIPEAQKKANAETEPATRAPCPSHRHRIASWCDHLYLTGAIAAFGHETRPCGCKLALDGVLHGAARLRQSLPDRVSLAAGAAWEVEKC